MASTRYYKIRNLGTGSYLTNKGKSGYKWGSLSKATLFDHNSLVRFLSKHYKSDTLPDNWEIVRYNLLESISHPAEEFYLKWTKHPPIKT